MGRDAILLHGMTFYGYHGLHPEERRLGQRFVVDLEASYEIAAAGQSDDPSLIISYSDLYRLAREVVQGPPRQLLETLAEEIAARVLGTFPAIETVTVTVWKPGAPIAGSILDRVGVRVTRTRNTA